MEANEILPVQEKLSMEELSQLATEIQVASGISSPRNDIRVINNGTIGRNKSSANIYKNFDHSVIRLGSYGKKLEDTEDAAHEITHIVISQKAEKIENPIVRAAVEEAIADLVALEVTESRTEKPSLANTVLSRGRRYLSGNTETVEGELNPNNSQEIHMLDKNSPRHFTGKRYGYLLRGLRYNPPLSKVINFLLDNPPTIEELNNPLDNIESVLKKFDEYITPESETPIQVTFSNKPKRLF